MTMKGFDPKWKDFPDYILGITKEIWEERNIASLNHYYTADLAVRTPASTVIGNKDVIAATMATLAEFPDRELLGEDVIWSGDEDAGFLSSHRLLCKATHSKSGVYGQATGKAITYRVFADCAAKDNQIYDEWMVRDQSAIVRQMGWDPKTYAADLIAQEGGPQQCVQPLTPHNEAKAGYTGRGNTHAVGERYADILRRIMRAEMAVIPAEYDRACHLSLPGGVTGHGFAAADGFWMGLRAAFPSAQFAIHHQIGREDPAMPPRAAIRWSLTGRHDGWGAFARPSGADVHVMGIAHAEFGPWGLRREYVLIDETAIWKQILLKTG